MTSKVPASTTINVVLPAAGDGQRFRDAGYRRPKPFIEINNKSMIENVIDNLKMSGAEYTLLLRRAHIESNQEAVEKLSTKGCSIVSVDELTEGAACTVLLAREYYDSDQPLLIANTDQLVNFRLEEFYEDCVARDLDGSILVFEDLSRNPKWSFARVNETGQVVEVAEKRPISDLATVGIYLFRRGSDFIQAALEMIDSNDRLNNEFYTCPVYNYLINKGARIGIYQVSSDDMMGLGTPEDLKKYLEITPQKK